jgi:adenylate kinase family enzyme
MDSLPYQRFVIIGTTGAGKSTLAKRLAETIRGDYIELDALHWEPNWVRAPLDVFRARAQAATRSDCWVAAGNFQVLQDIIWTKAEVVIWLDYSLPLIFWQLLRRTIDRAITHEELWSGNVDHNIWMHLKFWSADSHFNTLFRTYWRRKREFPNYFLLQQYEHLVFLHFRMPRETKLWLEKFS